ncbi:hypothetical protein QAD02_023013 [Eretmocerus hayati]|uniref:Uncharacterized protein n=1 Tax=Eretmocerus hayati TaxID=131215 RepID=A0ACC2PUE5_9HYME|nr:hypothetical protein QAD02_023013 [Eretmocerus hayati]
MNTLTESRQDELRREYFFNCDCPACEQNMPDFYPIEALLASKKVMENQLLKTFGKSASMLSEPVDTWHYSEKLYKAAVKMCEFLHNRFDAWESFYLSGDFRYYIQQCFLHLYNGDHVIRLPPIAC